MCISGASRISVVSGGILGAGGIGAGWVWLGVDSCRGSLPLTRPVSYLSLVILDVSSLLAVVSSCQTWDRFSSSTSSCDRCGGASIFTRLICAGVFAAWKACLLSLTIPEFLSMYSCEYMS